MAYLLRTVNLSLGATQVECQLSRAALVDNPSTEDAVTFCGTETFATPQYNLELAGFQDYGDVEAVCDMIHTAYKADPVSEIAFELVLGDVSTPGTYPARAGNCKPTQDLDFGGDAGSPLAFSVSLSVVGAVDDSDKVVT